MSKIAPSPPDVELVYTGDPMCSWCWGFAPVLAQLQTAFTVPLRVVVGGLRPGRLGGSLTPAMAKTISHHWNAVTELTGQPFQHGTLERRAAAGDWYYNTELPCIVVAAARDEDPELALPMMERLHRAFYVDGLDITDPDIYATLVDGLVPDVAAFLAEIGSESGKKRAWADFDWARSLGITGYPTLLLREDDRWSIVSQGWAPADQLISTLRQWLEDRHGAQASGMVCDSDGDCT